MRNRLSRSMRREARDFHRNFQSRLQSCTAIFDIEVCRRSVINLLFSQFSFESNDTFFFFLSLFFVGRISCSFLVNIRNIMRYASNESEISIRSIRLLLRSVSR